MAHTFENFTTKAHAPASNTAAVETLSSPGSGQRHYLRYVAWSYSGTPTNGKLTITGLEGGDTWEVDITVAGPGALPFPPLAGADNSAVVVTLAAGGSGVTGKVNVSYYTHAGYPKLKATP